MAAALRQKASEENATVTFPVDSVLSYGTDASCNALLALPSGQLQQVLLPDVQLDGEFLLEGSLSSLSQKTSCLLRLELHGTVSVLDNGENFKNKPSNVFDLLTSMNNRMEALAMQHHATRPLELVDATVSINSKTYSLKTLPPVSVPPLPTTTTTSPSLELVAKPSANELSYSNGCGNQSEWINNDILNKLLPREFVNQQVTVLPSGLNLNNDPDGCALALTVNSQIVPTVTNDLTFGLLKSIDDQLTNFIASAQTNPLPTVERAAVTLNLQSLPPSSTILEKSKASFDTDSTRIAMAGLAAFVVLCAMFLAVNGMRKEHERFCKEKHANASKAAQLRRVSIKLKYNKLRNVPGEEVEEEKTELI